MGASYGVHIVAGGIGLLSGYLALFAPKGSTLHRRSGIVFVGAMLVMCFFGTLMAAVQPVWPSVNVPAGVLTAYLVTTALLAVRPVRAARWLDVGLMTVALAVGITMLVFAAQAVAAGGTRNGIPAFPFVLFGVVGTLAGVLDLRMLRAGGVRGPARLTRHLWRMSFALFIAAMSFFLGQADEFPAWLRIPALLAVPVVTVPGVMLYWLWRVRMRRSFRGVIRVGISEAA
ncbi:MAG TPA: hypothetical protein VK928_01295 [Longimicrobiales bacterium]|nr:hypothetical protein [Longimicrobiales bacterium]